MQVDHRLQNGLSLLQLARLEEGKTDACLNVRQPRIILFVGNALNQVCPGATEAFAGKAAGVRTAAVTWGFTELPALLAAGPDLLLRDPAELARLPWMA